MSYPLGFYPNFRYGLLPPPIQFHGVKAVASNIKNCTNPAGAYTIEDFYNDFPSFKNKDPEGDPFIPDAVLQSIIDMANGQIASCAWAGQWRWAMGMFVAHYATLYLRYSQNPEGSSTPGEAAAGGQVIGIVSSARLGDAQVQYDVTAITSATADWGPYNSTVYGQQLVWQARFIGMGGSYAI